MQFFYQTVKEILDTGRVGVPVFVRCVVQIAPRNEHIIDTLARILTLTGSWLEAVPMRVYVQHHNSMQITASIQYTGGQTAIVSVNVASDVPPCVDLMMLGNKGAIYHDGTTVPIDFDVAFEPLPVPEWLLCALKRSLHIGKPTIIEEV